ncbi:MAG: dihydrodipicolinate synthase family protein [Anaerolineae bacterium]|nr:dihydrodipicolinate synthase family protein [Anaerolineae bacterium]
MSQATLSLRGVFPPISTPFGPRGEVAHGALRENLARWNQYHLAGYVVLGSNGEAVYLDWEEKLQVLRTVREVAAPGKLVIAGVDCESTREAIRLVRAAADAGADAALVVTPHYYTNRMSAESLVHHYHAVAEASPIPILIYNVPPYTHLDMDAAAVARAAEHPRVIGMKESGGNVVKMGDVVRLAPPDFQLLAGSAGFFLAGLAVGAVGGVMALANIAPQETLDLYRLFHEGRMEEAAALQRRMIPVNTAVTARFGVAGLKAALDMLGYYGGPVRAPLLDLNEDERRTLRRILEEGGLLPPKG